MGDDSGGKQSSNMASGKSNAEPEFDLAEMDDKALPALKAKRKEEDARSKSHMHVPEHERSGIMQASEDKEAYMKSTVVVKMEEAENNLGESVEQPASEDFENKRKKFLSLQSQIHNLHAEVQNLAKLCGIPPHRASAFRSNTENMVVEKETAVLRLRSA